MALDHSVSDSMMTQRDSNHIFRPLCMLRALVVLPAIVAAAVVAASPQELTLQLDPAQTTIRFTLGDVLHTVNGSFKLKSGTIHFNPAVGTASGQVVVDVTSGNTGSKARDRKMHKDILESSKYPDATFTPTKVSGPPWLSDRETFEVTGVFNLHGTDHPVELTFPITLKGLILTTHTQMVLPYVAWGLKNPSTFILRVNDKLDLYIDATGRLLQASAQVTVN